MTKLNFQVIAQKWVHITSVFFVICIICFCSSRVFGQSSSPKKQVSITNDDGKVTINAPLYSWTWQADNDQFTLNDHAGRRIVSGPLQPAVVVNNGRGTAVRCSAGQVDRIEINDKRLLITYKNVNTNASVKIAWRFDADGLWQEPVEYTGIKGEDVVRLYYFSKTLNNQPNPGLSYSWLIQPGISAAASVGPIQDLGSRINLDSWLGRGSTMDPKRLIQQWALPAHFFCGMTKSTSSYQVSGLSKLVSDTFCCGLADLPAGDLRLVTYLNSSSPVIDIRSDLWGQARGIGPFKLGATFYWSISDTYRNAISKYYSGLVHAGVIKPKQNTAAKNAILALSEFNTWGAQLAINKHYDMLDQQGLDDIYSDVRKSGMKAGAFVIDAKWQNKYGPLEHAESRLPDFDNFIKKVRADGLKLGMWAAFFRCETPADMGLSLKNMLQDTSGKPVVYKSGKPYYLLDVSQPIVQEALRKVITKFMQHYHPDIVKFDFGYEMPAIATSIPANPDWAGERMMKKFLEVAVGVLRQQNPDVVVMYYALSPLFLNEFDIHSTDDLFLNDDEFAIEANRRLYFSSLLGEIGMPSYGSGGYNWIHITDIWFDTIVSGALGSLGSFRGDPVDSKLQSRDLAKFNGLVALSRKANNFKIEPLEATKLGANGARASSWIRYEGGVPVLMALRTQHIITGDPIVASYKDQVNATAMLVIASADEKDIIKTKKLEVVPFGNGSLTVRHMGKAKNASVIAHYLKSNLVETVNYPLKNGFLEIPLREKSKNGTLIERFEINFNE